MLAHARHAEIVGLAADGDDQGVVGKAAPRHDLDPGIVQGGGDMDQPAGAVETVHASEPVAEMMPARLGQILELIRVGIQAPGGHFVK